MISTSGRALLAHSETVKREQSNDILWENSVNMFWFRIFSYEVLHVDINWLK